MKKFILYHILYLTAKNNRQKPHVCGVLYQGASETRSTFGTLFT